jgi:hypothetical protein
MGLLRPTRKAIDPEGREWEVYVSRTQLPQWRTSEHELLPDPVHYSALGVLLDAVFTILGAVLLPLVRVVAALPSALWRSRKARVYRIEAITYWPHRQTQTWTTQPTDLEEALIAITAGIRKGIPARPACAIYLGQSEG